MSRPIAPLESGILRRSVQGEPHPAGELIPRPVVVTGLGVISPIGNGWKRFWRNLLAGCCAVGPVEAFDTQAFTVHFGAEVKGFKPTEYLQRLSPTCIGRASQFAIAAARLALQDAALRPEDVDPKRAGVAIGTTSGEPRIIEAFDDCYLAEKLQAVGADFARTYPCGVLAANVAVELGLGGEVTTIPTACAAGNYAVAHAFDVLRSGRAEVMLAGGADCFSRITYTGFARLGAIAPERCQPFDRERKGMIPGEGAGILVLERLDHAQGRGARVYAQIAGYGLSCDASHMTAADPDGRGAARAMEMALRSSQSRPEEIDYISAHGTGTRVNDRLETIAIKRVFREHAYRIPVSSIKSMVGHMMGAASAIEAICCALAINEGQIPPTIHLESPDPECDLDYVPQLAREHRVNVAMNNAYAFGGSNSSLILKRCDV
jgi:3-oxoacyl-[acyl-carrier-protein] synthase II